MNTEVKTPTAQDLLGVWNLVRWEITYADGRPTTYPFGPNATGLIQYTHDGGMAACIARAGRAPLSSASVRSAPAPRVRPWLRSRSTQKNESA